MTKPYPRRGERVDTEPHEPAHLIALAAGDAGHIRAALEEERTDPDIREAGLAYLAGRTTPLGAAAVLTAHLGGPAAQEQPLTGPLAATLVETDGVAFAASTCAHLAAMLGFYGHYYYPGQVKPVRRFANHQFTRYYYSTVVLSFAAAVRAALAIAPDGEFEATVAELESLRAGNWPVRIVTSFLVPSQSDWVDADFAEFATSPDEAASAVFLAGAVQRPEHLALVENGVCGAYRVPVGRLAATMAAQVGPVAAEVLLTWASGTNADVTVRREVPLIVGELDDDEAFRALLRRADQQFFVPALADASARFPERAVRLLAGSAGQAAVGPLFRAHVLSHREAAERVLPELPAAHGARVRLLLSEIEAPPAPDSALPEVLVRPRWTRKRPTSKPVVVTGLSFTAEPAMRWADGERDRWKAGWTDRGWNKTPSAWASYAPQFDAGTLNGYSVMPFLLLAPPEVVGPRIHGWINPDLHPHEVAAMRLMAARWELAMYPTVLDAARRRLNVGAGLVLPYESVELAEFMADRFARLKSARRPALAWLRRHAAFAARVLVPRALAAPGPDRRSAEKALRALEPDVVRTAAEHHGPEAAAGIDVLLASDPLDAHPARPPKAPAWLDPAVLARVRLAGGDTVLGPDAVGHLLTALAISTVDEPYAGLAEVRAACDPASLDRFVLSLFEAWRLAGYPTKQGWVLAALGLLGGDESVRRLAGLVEVWPGESASKRAADGLDVLAAIGSELALMRLHRIGQRVKFKNLKKRATEKVDQIAEELGLTEEQLGDRLVPDFGLSAEGSMVLDYGPRSFTVGFDEQLKPYVVDPDGKPRKVLPRPSKTDDQERATAAYALFGGLKKDVKTVAADQLRRLERAMVAGRSWTGAEFDRYFAGHPLMWHVVRRLVWCGPAGAFRIAEDRTLADLDDKPVELADDATVMLPHPLRLGADALAAWSEVFADYEILQPFPQLGREVCTLGPAEAGAGALDRFEGRTTHTGPLFGLRHRGWDTGYGASRDAGDGLRITLDLTPDLAYDYGYGQDNEEHTLGLLRIWRDGDGGSRPATFGEADPVLISETLRDLDRIT